jgi:hypothetical protein
MRLACEWQHERTRTHAPGILRIWGLDVTVSTVGSGQAACSWVTAACQEPWAIGCRVNNQRRMPGHPAEWKSSASPLPLGSSVMEPLHDAARQIQLRLFGHFTVTSVLDDESRAGIDRDLDIVELWAGVMSVTLAGRRRGYRAEAFALIRVPGTSDVPGPKCEDLTSEFGFINALTLVLRLRAGGLLGMSPVCSSFVFSNMANTKRIPLR